MFIYIIIGIISGILSGLGIGGGTILIPSLLFFCDIDQKTAQQLNLLYFIPTALISIFIHSKNKNVEKEPLRFLIISGVIGAILGSFLGIRLDSELMKRFFAFFLLFMGIREFKKPVDCNKMSNYETDLK